MNENLFGVLCKADKTFYYLESGDNHVVNTVPRITKALVARGLIELTGDNPYTYSQYEVMTIKDAISKEMEPTPIYINDHVRSMVEMKEKAETSTKWK